MRHPSTPVKTLMIVAAAILLGAPVSLAASTSSRSGSHHASAPSDHPFGSGDGEPADTSLLHQCTMLSKQFDQAKAAHKTDKSYKEALTLSNEGKAMCRSVDNKQAAGVEYLHSAMKLIGIKANI
jgi:hypothetical protein